uniref:PB1-like domain-containing protein n=1 Tax=Lactuca sativa TaxID=4236 RepID=A0A9R1XTD6_LACSA|nr:hypothetical protein LSAT_V11C100003530 [Lactuca sativa]
MMRYQERDIVVIRDSEILEKMLTFKKVMHGCPSIFSIELHHGGNFINFPNIRYTNGQARYFDVVDIDEFYAHELDLMMREIGYDSTEIMCYHFCLPNEGFDFGIRALGSKDYVHNCSQYVTHKKLIKVYTENRKMNFFTYFMSPKGPRRVIIEEIGNEEPSRPAFHVVSYQVVTSFQNEVDEGYLGLTLTFLQGSSCSIKLNLDWEVANEIPTNIHIDDDLMTNFQPLNGLKDQDNIPFHAKILFLSMMIEDKRVLVIWSLKVKTVKTKMFTGCHSLGGQRNEESDQEEDVEVIDNDAWDSLSDDSGDNRKIMQMIKDLGKQKLCSAGEVKNVALHVGQKYKAKNELKYKVYFHDLETRRNISFTKNYKSRLTTICDDIVVVNASGVSGPTSGKNVKDKDVNCEKVKCTWRLHASRSNVEDYWFIKTYNHKHTASKHKKSDIV